MSFEFLVSSFELGELETLNSKLTGVYDVGF